MASTGSTKNPKKANLLDPHSIKHLLDESVSEVNDPLLSRSIDRSIHPSVGFLSISLDHGVLWAVLGFLACWKRFQVVTSRGYVEDVRLSNVRLLIGSIIIAIALLAQFYPKKFPENKDFLIGCIGLYPFCFGVLWPILILFCADVDLGFLDLVAFWRLLFFLDSWFFDSGKYIAFNGLLQFISYTKEKNAILFTYPPPVSFSSPFLLLMSYKSLRLDCVIFCSATPKSLAGESLVHWVASPL